MANIKISKKEKVMKTEQEKTKRKAKEEEEMLKKSE